VCASPRKHAPCPGAVTNPEHKNWLTQRSAVGWRVPSRRGDA
jgi:hypothetical protein